MFSTEIERKLTVILSPYEAEMLFITIRNKGRNIPIDLSSYFKGKKMLRDKIGDVNPVKTRLGTSEKYRPGRGNKMETHQKKVKVKFYGEVEYKDLRDLYDAMCKIEKRFLYDEDKLLNGWMRDIFFASLKRIKSNLIKGLKAMSVSVKDMIKSIQKDDFTEVKGKAIKELNKIDDEIFPKQVKEYIRAFINGYPSTLYNDKENASAELELVFAHLVNDEDYNKVIKPLSQRYVDFCKIKVELINLGFVEKLSENSLRRIAKSIPAKKKGRV